MTRRPAIRLAAFSAAWTVIAVAAPAPARGDLDLDSYGDLLSEYTIETPETVGTRVDYRGIAADSRWPALIAGLERARPSTLRSRSERLAFWINAYNVLAIRMVIEHYPVDSIRDIGSLFRSVWKRPVAEIDGREVTLDQIEHAILRKMGDPRIHAAIVCASTSCPSLAREPYTADGLDLQLDTTLKRWMASREKGLRIDRAKGEVALSSIFDWFAEDFEQAGGAVAFAARYAPEGERAWLREQGAEVRVAYLDYDWSLNDWRR